MGSALKKRMSIVGHTVGKATGTSATGFLKASSKLFGSVFKGDKQEPSHAALLNLDALSRELNTPLSVSDDAHRVPFQQLWRALRGGVVDFDLPSSGTFTAVRLNLTTHALTPSLSLS